MVHIVYIIVIFTDIMNRVMQKKILTLFNNNHGYAKMQELKDAGIHTRDVASALQSGIIEKFAPGKYKLINYPWDEFSSFTDIAFVRTDAVVCLQSAAEYHGLTTYNPSVVAVAVPKGSRGISLSHPPVSVHFFSPDQYKTEILTVKAAGGEFSVYSMEKTVVDLFRFRNKAGMDLVLEVLKSYLSRKDRNINLLLHYARKFRVYSILNASLKAMVV